MVKPNYYKGVPKFRVGRSRCDTHTIMNHANTEAVPIKVIRIINGIKYDFVVPIEFINNEFSITEEGLKLIDEYFENLKKQTSSQIV